MSHLLEDGDETLAPSDRSPRRLYPLVQVTVFAPDGQNGSDPSVQARKGLLVSQKGRVEVCTQSRTRGSHARRSRHLVADQELSLADIGCSFLLERWFSPQYVESSSWQIGLLLGSRRLRSDFIRRHQLLISCLRYMCCSDSGRTQLLTAATHG